MAELSPKTISAARERLGIDAERMPRSVAIIMDGNGRWAKARGLPREVGHDAGAKVVRKIVTESARLGLENLTLYSFSIENWSRPTEEVNSLMHLYADYLVRERQTVMEHNIRVRHLGRRDGLPETVLRELDETVRRSSTNTGMFLCLALNYGSRTEIADAVRELARRVEAGELASAGIDERLIGEALDTSGVPDPDLVIRTSGEMRVSNFLLWQISYAELYCTEVFWPEFTVEELHKALHAYAARQRRFGGLRDKAD